MVRKDNDASFTRDAGCFGRSPDRYTFHTGGRKGFAVKFTGAEFRTIQNASTKRAVCICEGDGKRWWAIGPLIYWENEGHDTPTMTAILLDRLEKEQRKLDKLKAKFQIEE